MTAVPSSAARGRILQTAIRLFYARGLRAVGVDTIIAESGVAKATFYGGPGPSSCVVSDTAPGSRKCRDEPSARG